MLHSTIGGLKAAASWNEESEPACGRLSALGGLSLAGWPECLMADYKACLVVRLSAGAAHRTNDRGIHAMKVFVCLHMMHANHSVGQA